MPASPHGPAQLPDPGLVVLRVPSRHGILLRAEGFVDLATVAVLRDALDAALDDGSETIEIELGAVDFCDVVGLSLLLEVDLVLRQRGGGLTVVDPCPSLDLLLSLLPDPDRHLRVRSVTAPTPLRLVDADGPRPDR